MSGRVDKLTEKFVTKEVHGQLVKVRVMKPYTEEDEERGRGARPKETKVKRVKKKYCTFCEVEIFDPGKTCDLCGRDFHLEA